MAIWGVYNSVIKRITTVVEDLERGDTLHGLATSNPVFILSQKQLWRRDWGFPITFTAGCMTFNTINFFATNVNFMLTTSLWSGHTPY